jgi:DNA-binding PadR family transcriptional regulator
MSISMSLLSILDQGSSYGLRLKQDFEERTGGVWPLNVGQVYKTLDRLGREGLVREVDAGESDRQRLYEMTAAGRERLERWFTEPLDDPPGRDPLVLKLVMAARHPAIDTGAVIQAERRGAVEVLQRYTRLKRDPADDADMGWAFLVDSLIFKAEARVRWLDTCEERLRKGQAPVVSSGPAGRTEPERTRQEVRQ